MHRSGLLESVEERISLGEGKEQELRGRLHLAACIYDVEKMNQHDGMDVYVLVCLYECMYIWLYGCILYMVVCMYVYMHVLYVCIYVCMFYMYVRM